MLDVSNYKELKEQYKALKNELKTYSEKLSNNPFAIAFTKIDTLTAKEVNGKIQTFFDEFSLKKSSENRYGFDKNYLFYNQNDYTVDTVKPLFAIPISAVANTNIDALKFALFDGVNG